MSSLNTIPQANGFVAAMAGETGHMQCWYRDTPSGGGAVNVTSATSVTFR